VGHSYNKNITAGGGTSPYSFTVVSGTLPPGLALISSGVLSGTPTSSGTLPPGLALTSSGVLSGTPTSPGNFTFAIQAADSNGCTGTKSYSLMIVPH
jgi:hypothetical protein